MESGGTNSGWLMPQPLGPKIKGAVRQRAFLFRREIGDALMNPAVHANLVLLWRFQNGVDGFGMHWAVLLARKTKSEYRISRTAQDARDTHARSELAAGKWLRRIGSRTQKSSSASMLNESATATRAPFGQCWA